ncbi:MAG: LysR family transcriptional regulator [Clostridiales bacterium]|nr:LysR family transcriptional regulator [Clostridiales bacterium]
MNFKQISLLQINYFLELARHLNFTEAAKSLYVSQPSLSKQIALFEKEIGIQLFFRTKRSVRLTPAGAVLLKELSGINEHMENAIMKAKQPNIGENSTLSIGFLEAMDTGSFLPRLIREFTEKYPGVELSFERHSFKALREKLINGALDIIFTISFEIDDTMGVLYDMVYKTNSSIVMSSAHPMAARESLSLSELSNENFIFISRDESPKGFDSEVNCCNRYGFTPRIVKQVPNIESILLNVESGLGVALFDSSIRLYNKDAFKLFKVDDDFIGIVMAWKKENLNPAIPLFSNSILQKVED